MSARRRRANDPTGPYLEHRAYLRVRFQDVDSIHVVWHGHYLSYFEHGRESFGEEFGLGYQDVKAAGVVAPVVHVSIDYLQPARFGDELTIVTRLYPSARAEIALSYEVRRASDEALLAKGRTRQVFTDLEGNLLLNQPPIMRRFLAQWQDQLIEG
jgi:acyl-CoA thioester hydrolase